MIKCEFKDIDNYIVEVIKFTKNKIIKENLINLTCVIDNWGKSNVYSEKQVWYEITQDMERTNPEGKIIFNIDFDKYLIDKKQIHDKEFNTKLDDLIES